MEQEIFSQFSQSLLMKKETKKGKKKKTKLDKLNFKEQMAIKDYH